MTHRFTMRSSADAIRRWVPPALVATVALIAAAPADAAPRQKQARPERMTEAVAPRAAGEPIMAIVSIKSQKVTVYDADGWISARAGVDRHEGTRDTGRCLQRRGEAQGPPFEPL